MSDVYRRYVILVGLFCCCAAGVVFGIAASGDQPFGIAQAGDSTWYRDIGGRRLQQIQDQDLFYSNVGRSIAAAAAADIVFLGPSFVNHAINRDVLRASPALERLSIYNMAFIGIRSGEFSRRLIMRWHLRPPLWIINVDDQIEHFFSNDLSQTLITGNVPIEAAERTRIGGYLAVARRNIQWRIEDARYGNPGGPPPGLDRNVLNGDMAFEMRSYYTADNNKPMPAARVRECHASQEQIDYGRALLSEIGGRVVFMLVPHSESCFGQAAELAAALHVELIAPPADGLTTFDGGGHLDRHGAVKFTRDLVAALVRTDAFRQSFGRSDEALR